MHSYIVYVGAHPNYGMYLVGGGLMLDRKTWATLKGMTLWGIGNITVDYKLVEIEQSTDKI